jgi:hypothetical protein
MVTYNERKTSDKNVQVIQILKAHSVPHYELYGDIYADSMIGGTELFEEVINVSEMSRAELLSWLGY